MPPLSQALDGWHSFYEVLGAACATMIGLLFVAASVAGGMFSRARRGAQRVFLSASVVHFSSILAVSLIVLAPVQWWEVLGGAIVACGVCGLGYCLLGWRDLVRDGIAARVDLEDRVWYVALPALCHLAELAVGVALILRQSLGCTALAVTMGALLLIAIHNAWDITVWSVTRSKE